MMEIIIATTLTAAALLWFSTKTDNSGFKKLFIFLGILLIALSFLQISVITPEQRLVNQTTNYTYDNTTGEWLVNQTVQASTYENLPGGDVVSTGNLALFIIFGFVLFLITTWFIIDLLGMTKDNLGRIVRRKPPRN